MTRDDLALIRHYSEQEIRDTGATLASVKLDLFLALDRFRDTVCRPVLLLYGGLTTGRHASPLHPRGEAADICFREVDGPNAPRIWVMSAFVSGFRGVGLYYNGVSYSMHLDLRLVPGSWTRWRHHGEQGWHEAALIVDPATMEGAYVYRGAPSG